MAIVTRTGKGSKLTIQEMDGNLTTLDNQSFKDGVYTITSGSRTDSITALASGSIEIKSLLTGDGAVNISGPGDGLSFIPTSFNTDTIVVGEYTGIQPTGGSGEGLTVTVFITESRAVPTIINVIVTDGGTGYEIGDVVSIATSELGADPSNESTTYTLTDGDMKQDQQQRILMDPTGISMPDLPTGDPGVAGQLYVNDGGPVNVSSGG